MKGPIIFIDLIPELRDSPEDLILQTSWKYYYKCLLHWESWLGFVGLAGCLCLWDSWISLFSIIIRVEWVSVFEMFSLLAFSTLGVLIHNLLMVHAINREFRKEKD